jgi:hypothetical protein
MTVWPQARLRVIAPHLGVQPNEEEITMPQVSSEARDDIQANQQLLREASKEESWGQ